MGIARVSCCQGRHCRAGKSHDNVRPERDQFPRVFAKVRIASGPARVDANIGAVDPAQLLQSSQERRHAGLIYCIVRRRGQQHADAPHLLALLRARRKRPRSRSAAERG